MHAVFAGPGLDDEIISTGPTVQVRTCCLNAACWMPGPT